MLACAVGLGACDESMAMLWPGASTSIPAVRTRRQQLCAPAGAGSIVIITSRDRDALESRSAGCKGHIMLIDFLDAEHSRALFLLHCGSIPQGVTDNMVDAILSKCSGLPLSLKARSASSFQRQKPCHRGWFSACLSC